MGSAEKTLVGDKDGIWLGNADGESERSKILNGGKVARSCTSDSMLGPVDGLSVSIAVKTVGAADDVLLLSGAGMAEGAADAVNRASPNNS